MHSSHRSPVLGFGSLASCALALAAGLFLSSAADAACTPGPVPALTGLAGIYGGSEVTRDVPIPSIVARNTAILAPITALDIQFNNQMDGTAPVSKPIAADCTFITLNKWTSGGLFLDANSSLEEVYDKSDAVLSLALSTIKLAGLNTGLNLTALQNWLEVAGRNTASAFTAAHLGDNNLTWWNGASAAAVGRLNHDNALVAYGASALAREVSEVRADGTLAAELARGQRAYIYTLRAYNGAMMLEGLTRNCWSVTCLEPGNQRLNALVLRAIQNPSILSAPSGGYVQETITGGSLTNELYLVCLFNGNRALAACGQRQFPDARFGGSLVNVQAALARGV
jgi:hypothetical protein